MYTHFPLLIQARIGLCSSGNEASIWEGSLGLEDDRGSDGVSESQESSSEVSQDGTVGKGQTETKVFLGFDVWLERLADGTLKRHSVELWPLLR